MSPAKNRADTVKLAKGLAKGLGDMDMYDRFNVKPTAMGCPLSLFLEMHEYIRVKRINNVEL